jgi:hypothetical protein
MAATIAQLWLANPNFVLLLKGIKIMHPKRLVETHVRGFETGGKPNR